MNNNALNLMRALAEEHFEEFLIVVAKDGEVKDLYSGAISAYGMASLVKKDISKFWGSMPNRPEEQEL